GPAVCSNAYLRGLRVGLRLRWWLCGLWHGRQRSLRGGLRRILLLLGRRARHTTRVIQGCERDRIVAECVANDRVKRAAGREAFGQALLECSLAESACGFAVGVFGPG